LIYDYNEKVKSEYICRSIHGFRSATEEEEEEEGSEGSTKAREFIFSPTPLASLYKSCQPTRRSFVESKMPLARTFASCPEPGSTLFIGVDVAELSLEDKTRAAAAAAASASEADCSNPPPAASCEDEDKASE
jgi:hypothetical protein